MKLTKCVKISNLFVQDEHLEVHNTRFGKASNYQLNLECGESWSTWEIRGVEYKRPNSGRLVRLKKKY